MSKVVKIRLNADIRKELNKFAETLVTFPEQVKAVQEAYESAKSAIISEHSFRFPWNDLLVLEKWSCVERQKSFNITDGLRFQRWCFNDERHLIFPISWEHRRQLKTSQVTFDLVENYNHLMDKYDTSRAALLNDYKNLINAARTFEELAEVWPEVEVMRADIETRAGRRAISCLSVEALARIKADIATRKENE